MVFLAASSTDDAALMQQRSMSESFGKLSKSGSLSTSDGNWVRRFMSEESNELNGCQHVDRVFFREKRVGKIHVRRVQSISNRRTVSKGFDRWLSAAEC